MILNCVLRLWQILCRAKNQDEAKSDTFCTTLFKSFLFYSFPKKGEKERERTVQKGTLCDLSLWRPDGK